VKAVDYLDLEDLLILVRMLGAGPIRDVGLLESAAARPRTSLFGDDAYPSVEFKAAALMRSLCKNDALVDGNTRLALLSTVTFLRMNGFPFTMSQDEACDLTMRVAEGVAEGVIDVPEIATALARAWDRRAE
jgi:death-on-curing protein